MWFLGWSVSSCAIWIVGRKARTPHLPLLLEVGVYHAEGCFSRDLIVVDLDEVVYVEVEFSYFGEVRTPPANQRLPSTNLMGPRSTPSSWESSGTSSYPS